jgi:hypothetical protein
MRYELTDFECTAICPFLPNTPRGVPRVNDLGEQYFRMVLSIPETLLPVAGPGERLPALLVPRPCPARSREPACPA